MGWRSLLIGSTASQAARPRKKRISMKIETTADGSSTLYLPDLDEHYHSVKGAETESLHVYIKEGFLEFASHSTEERPVRILEIGFGTGLNAALTLQHASQGSEVLYHTLELHPLPAEVTGSLHYQLPAEYMAAVNSAPWNQSTPLSPHFEIDKRIADFTRCKLPADIDVVYFDAFAPEKQPEMWEPHLLQKIYDAMRPGGVFVTYCAKGAIRRALAAAGFTPERIPGPPGGKREILRARK